MNTRSLKVLLGTSASLYMFLVCFNNITDYGSNFQFVKNVSGMTDVFAFERTGWRSVQNETLHHIIYVFIIVCEIGVFFLALTGTVRMAKSIRAASDQFHRSKKWLITALVLGVVLWFGVFISIAGEWFLMWQSVNWNGQNTAFMLTICFMLFLVFVNQRDE